MAFFKSTKPLINHISHFLQCNHCLFFFLFENILVAFCTCLEHFVFSFIIKLPFSVWATKLVNLDKTKKKRKKCLKVAQEISSNLFLVQRKADTWLIQNWEEKWKEAKEVGFLQGKQILWQGWFRPQIYRRFLLRWPYKV